MQIGIQYIDSVAFKTAWLASDLLFSDCLVSFEKLVFALTRQGCIRDKSLSANYSLTDSLRIPATDPVPGTLFNAVSTVAK